MKTKTPLVNRNVTGSAGRTSMRMEPDMWQALEEICHRENRTLADLIQGIEASMTFHAGQVEHRTSAVRCYVLAYYRRAATEAGHKAARHGTLDGPESTGWRPAAPRGVRARG